MEFALRKATRQKAKLRLGLAGPSGSGKTYSALLISYGLVGDWSKVAIIDTENGSADLYEGLGEYNVLSLTAPYSPERYIDAVKYCVDAGMECVIIDSITHEWNGKGGCLELHEKKMQSMRIPNSYTAWAEITPRHQSFIDCILQSPIHIITTVRTKTEYVLIEKNGKQVPEKVGMAAQTRDGFEYELTIFFELGMDHRAFPSKDRTGLFAGKEPAVLTIETGKILAQWCDVGEPLKPKLAKFGLNGEIAPLWQKTCQRVRAGVPVTKVTEHFELEPELLEELISISKSNGLGKKV